MLSVHFASAAAAKCRGAALRSPAFAGLHTIRHICLFIYPSDGRCDAWAWPLTYKSTLIQCLSAMGTVRGHWHRVCDRCPDRQAIRAPLDAIHPAARHDPSVPPFEKGTP